MTDFENQSLVDNFRATYAKKAEAMRCMHERILISLEKHGRGLNATKFQEHYHRMSGRAHSMLKSGVDQKVDR